MKKLVSIVFAGGLLIAGCSSSSASAESKYNDFKSKYSEELKELASAFGESDPQTFEEYLPSACEPIDDGSTGMAIVIFGPVLARHGHDVVEFMADIREIGDAARKEGLCA